MCEGLVWGLPVPVRALTAPFEGEDGGEGVSPMSEVVVPPSKVSSEEEKEEKGEEEEMLMGIIKIIKAGIATHPCIMIGRIVV